MKKVGLNLYRTSLGRFVEGSFANWGVRVCVVDSAVERVPEMSFDIFLFNDYKKRDLLVQDRGVLTEVVDDLEAEIHRLRGSNIIVTGFSQSYDSSELGSFHLYKELRRKGKNCLLVGSFDRAYWLTERFHFDHAFVCTDVNMEEVSSLTVNPFLCSLRLKIQRMKKRVGVLEIVQQPKEYKRVHREKFEDNTRDVEGEQVQRYKKGLVKGMLASRSFTSYGRLAVCTTYFNPVGYQTKRKNWNLFKEASISQGAEIWVAEAGDGKRWEIEEEEKVHVLRLVMGDRLWQKERMLNLLFGVIPSEYEKIAWVDNDLLFDNPTWVFDTCKVLEEFPVAQLFEYAVWLNAFMVPHFWNPDYDLYRCSIPRELMERGRDEIWFGKSHPGFAWAARRGVLNSLGGLYERHILGSGDSIIVLGFYGWEDHKYFDGIDGAFRGFCLDWMRKAYNIVKGRVGFVPGVVRHLWHGSREDRQYDSRLVRLMLKGFDPEKHLSQNEFGLWIWNDSAPDEIKDFVYKYFDYRREDGSIRTENVRFSIEKGK